MKFSLPIIIFFLLFISLSFSKEETPSEETPSNNRCATNFGSRKIPSTLKSKSSNTKKEKSNIHHQIRSRHNKKKIRYNQKKSRKRSILETKQSNNRVKSTNKHHGQLKQRPLEQQELNPKSTKNIFQDPTAIDLGLKQKGKRRERNNNNARYD